MDDKGKPVHPITADALKPVVDAHTSKGEEFKMSMVFPTSTHNYELRYWLAAGGIHPGFYGTTADAKARNGRIDADAKLLVSPPAQMPRLLEDGKIAGYCVGEPWNQKAVASGIGVPVVIDHHSLAVQPRKSVRYGRNVCGGEPQYHRTHRPRVTPRGQVARRERQRHANRLEAVDILELKCNRCHRQTSITAGTIFDSTKTAAHRVVPSHLPHEPGQERGLCDETAPPSGHLLQSSVAHATQADAGDDGARLPVSPHRLGRAR